METKMATCEQTERGGFCFLTCYMLDLTLFTDYSILLFNIDYSTKKQNKMLKTYEEWV